MINYITKSQRLKIGALLCLLWAFLSVFSCGTTKYIPVEGKTEVKINYVDSLRIRDSIVVVPVERIVNISAQYDTLVLETTLAKSVTYLDTTYHALRGSIENKEQVVYRDRWRDRIVEKCDTVTIREPIPYEVVKEKRVIPKWVWGSLVFNIIETAMLCLLIYLLFFKRIW